MTRGLLYQFFADDHARLEGLLHKAGAQAGKMDRVAYAEFRSGLLKHISMEEKILLPAAQQACGGTPLPVAAKLRLDHGALAALLVPSPTPAIISAIRAVLSAHNPIEEGPGGMYETCEGLLNDRIDEIVAKLKSAPEVTTAPHVDGPNVTKAIRHALERAGQKIDL